MTSDQHSNLWWASCREHPDALPLAHDTTVDLAVIGGGFTGCAAALEAAKQGASVCLLEAGEIGDGGSGRNVGLVNAGLWLPPDTVIENLGPDAGTKLINILGEAPARVFSLIDREEIDCEATRNGTLHLAHTSTGLRSLQSRHEQGHRSGAPLKLLNEKETACRTGSSAFKGALLDPRAGTIQPLAYCRGLARAAAHAGASIHPRSLATSVEFLSGVWIVKANGQTVRAKRLLFATNAYHHGIQSPFNPAFSTVSYSQFATAPLSESERAKVLPNGEGCWDTALIMSSFRMDQSGRLIVGGIGNIEGRTAKIHKSWARKKLLSVFPDLGDLPFEYAWQGKIAMTDDHIPKIVEVGPSAIACFGYSGRGIGPGTVFGTQSAIALLGENPEALPIAPIGSYFERFSGLKTNYYEFGASLTHMLRPLEKL